jgi:hypothetical protein
MRIAMMTISVVLGVIFGGLLIQTAVEEKNKNKR